MEKVYTQSEINKMLKSGEAIEGPLRQVVTSVKTGKILSNGIVQAVTLPPAIVTRSDTYVYYNDIDIKQFKDEVKVQTSIIVQELRDGRFNNAGVQYQQFLDQFVACMESPTQDHLSLVRAKGIDLYATLQDSFMATAGAINPYNNLDQDVEKKFYALAEANLNLFFHMIIINLAKFNRIDDVQGQLRSKLEFFKDKLQTLLNDYVFAKPDANQWRDSSDVDEWKTLYGWILLNDYDLATAMAIYDNHENIINQCTFPELFKKVMAVFTPSYGTKPTHPQIIRDNFTYAAVQETRVRIAKQIAYYIQQCKQIHAYLDELISQSSDVPNNATELELDIKSLVLPPAADNLPTTG